MVNNKTYSKDHSQISPSMIALQQAIDAKPKPQVKPSIPIIGHHHQVVNLKVNSSMESLQQAYQKTQQAQQHKPVEATEARNRTPVNPAPQSYNMFPRSSMEALQRAVANHHTQPRSKK